MAQPFGLSDWGENTSSSRWATVGSPALQRAVASGWVRGADGPRPAQPRHGLLGDSTSATPSARSAAKPACAEARRRECGARLAPSLISSRAARPARRRRPTRRSSRASSRSPARRPDAASPSSNCGEELRPACCTNSPRARHILSARDAPPRQRPRRIARAAGADGVHSRRARSTRPCAGPSADFLIGVSTHTLEEARAGARRRRNFAVYARLARPPNVITAPRSVWRTSRGAHALAPVPSSPSAASRATISRRCSRGGRARRRGDPPSPTPRVWPRRERDRGRRLRSAPYSKPFAKPALGVFAPLRETFLAGRKSTQRRKDAKRVGAERL